MNRVRIASRLVTIRALVVAALFFVTTTVSVAIAQATSDKESTVHKTYVCPPCGQPCDSMVFDKPGTCPKCGMKLVDQATLQVSTP